MSVDISGASATAEGRRAQLGGAIQRAASITGTSFQYLLATAKMESNFDPGAKATTSSARGLFQFIDQTWLGTVKEAGPALGYARYAEAITRSPSGRYSVSDPAMRQAILDLRNDPVANAEMAGVLTHSNSFKLVGRIGRRPTDAELYMAHFMGVGGAAKLIINAENNPDVSGASLFPSAAAANKSIFYDRSGRARTVSEVYSVLTARYQSAANSPMTRAVMASVGASPAPERRTEVASAAPTDTAAYLAGFPDTRQGGAPSSGGVARDVSFRTLFHTGPRAEPVSSAVQRLWVTGSSAGATPEVRTPRSFDLFSDRTGVFSG